MRPAHLPAGVADVWDEVIAAYGEGFEAIEGPALEAYCGQVAILRDCQRRLATDGTVVEDPKGFPIPHPAIAMERSAQAEIRTWADKFQPRRRR